MRILHTSDWHLGRNFHGHSTLEAMGSVLDALVDVVREKKVDVVVVAGDVFDLAIPSGDAVTELVRVMRAINATGAQLIMTSGNHDSPARLGAIGAFGAAAGIHILTDAAAHATPVTINDEHGPVQFYGIAYLDPALIRHRWPDVPLKHQHDALSFAMTNVRADLDERGGRSVALAHTFVAGAEGESCTSERDIVVGSVDRVPTGVFDGVDYVALGHIHGRSTLADHLRYCGAPLHHSFSEANKPRGVWIVDLDADGLADVEWADLPIPRPLKELTGTIDELLADPDLDQFADHWVSVIATDSERPIDPMIRLRVKFPHVAQFEHRPPALATAAESYADRLKDRSDEEIVESFLRDVRADEPTEAELALAAEVIADVRAQEVNS